MPDYNLFGQGAAPWQQMLQALGGSGNWFGGRGGSNASSPSQVFNPVTGTAAPAVGGNAMSDKAMPIQSAPPMAQPAPTPPPTGPTAGTDPMQAAAAASSSQAMPNAMGQPDMGASLFSPPPTPGGLGGLFHGIPGGGLGSMTGGLR